MGGRGGQRPFWIFSENSPVSEAPTVTFFQQCIETPLGLLFYIKHMLLLYPSPFYGLSKEMFWHLSWHQKILTEEIKLLIIDYRCFARKGGVFKSATQFSRKTAGQINQELFFAGPSVFRLGITNKYVLMRLDQSKTFTFSLFSTVEIGDMVCSGVLKSKHHM